MRAVEAAAGLASVAPGAASATTGTAPANRRAREVFRIMDILLRPGVRLVVFDRRSVVLCDVKLDALGAIGLAGGRGRG